MVAAAGGDAGSAVWHVWRVGSDLHQQPAAHAVLYGAGRAVAEGFVVAAGRHRALVERCVFSDWPGHAAGSGREKCDPDC